MDSSSKGQVVIYGLMVALVVIVVTLAVSPLLKEQIDVSRSPTAMDCSNDSISNFDKAACISTDTTLFLFVGGLIAAAGAFLGWRMLK